MSDVENPVEGAATLPDEQAQPERAQEVPQESATANPDAPKDDQARDEKGRFVQKRINELTREKHEARRQAEQAARERDELRAELSRLRQPAAPDPAQDPAAYVRHLAREEAQSLVESQQSQWRQSQEQQRFQSLAQQYATREADYAASHPEYTEALEAFTSIAGDNQPELAEVLMTSDHGPAVVHYLGSHLDEAVNILAMPPYLAAAALARIEARVSAPKPKPTTNAPAPVPTLSGSAAVSKDPSKMTYAEYKKFRQG